MIRNASLHENTYSLRVCRWHHVSAFRFAFIQYEYFSQTGDCQKLQQTIHIHSYTTICIERQHKYSHAINVAPMEWRRQIRRGRAWVPTSECTSVSYIIFSVEIPCLPQTVCVHSNASMGSMQCIIKNLIFSFHFKWFYVLLSLTFFQDNTSIRNDKFLLRRVWNGVLYLAVYFWIRVVRRTTN